MAHEELIREIHDLENQLRSKRAIRTNCRKDVVEVVKQMDEWQDVKDAKEAVKDAQADLAEALKENPEFVTASEYFNDAKVEVDILETSLNDALLRYFEETGDKSVPNDDTTEQKIELTAHLGPPVHIQTTLDDLVKDGETTSDE